MHVALRQQGNARRSAADVSVTLGSALLASRQSFKLYNVTVRYIVNNNSRQVMSRNSVDDSASSGSSAMGLHAMPKLQGGSGYGMFAPRMNSFLQFKGAEGIHMLHRRRE